MALDLRFLTVSLMMPDAVELSVCIGVGPCGCPISSIEVLSTSPSLALMNRPPNSASAAEAITCFKMAAATNTAPLCLVREVGSNLLLRKKCPPTLLLALDAEIYDTSPCICNCIWLAKYLFVVSLWVHGCLGALGLCVS